VTAAEFKALFPEFQRTADALVESRIAWAVLRTPVDIWGDLQSQGIAWMAAHFLALLPEAKNLRKNMKSDADGLDSTSYGKERKRLNTIVSSGFRTAGPR
jgi:hypothetical protein